MLKRIFFPTIVVLLLFCNGLYAADKPVSYLEKSSQAFSRIVNQCASSVVAIHVEKKVTMGGISRPGFPFKFFDDDLLKKFFPDFGGSKRKRKVQGMGSGFIISSDGYILTNSHVVAKADKITVMTSNEKEYTAKLIGRDPKSDIAVIKIKDRDFPYLRFGDSEKLKPGEWVIAIGNPFGLASTVSVGVVSAKGRSGIGITDYEDFIQTDAAINRGNSGGPLINSAGKVVGINTAIFSQTGGYMGIGFAIPSNMAVKIKKQLVKKGKVTRGYVGIYIQPLTKEISENLDLDVTDGILISKVQDDTPADKAGLKPYDVIVGLNGKQVDDINKFRNQVAFMDPGQDVRIEVIRDNKRKSLDLEIGKMPTPEGEDTEEASVKTDRRLGFTVKKMTGALADKFGYDNTNGVIVSRVTPGSEAARKGIRPGVVILEVNRKQVANASEFSKAVQDTEKGKSLLLLVKTTKNMWFVTLKPE